MLACLTSLLIGASAVDSTAVPCISQMVHTTWTVDDGAPADIAALAQTTEGYLWLGTRSGPVVRFDGVRFVPVVRLGSDTLPSGGVRRLLGGMDGSLWVVWSSGSVSRIREGRVTSHGESDGLRSTYDLAESRTGTVVAGTSTGLSQFVDGQWRDVGRSWAYPGAEARAVWFDRDDALWAETEDRVVYLPAGEERFVDPGMMLTPMVVRTAFVESSDGTVWMAETARSAHTLPRLGDSLPLTEVKVGASSVLFDRRGSLWIGTYGDGLRRVVDPSRIRGRVIEQFGPEAEQFTRADGLLSDVVNALLEDGEGNIWVASDRGLERFREGAFTPIVTPSPGRARWIFAGRDSSLWTAAYNQDDVLRLGPDGSESIPTGSIVGGIAQDQSGVVWAESDGAILRWQGRRFVAVLARGRHERSLTGITVDPGGTVWVFEQDWGVLRLYGDSLVRAIPFNDPALPRGYVFSDSRGRIWMGKAGRVGLFDQGQLHTFGPEEGVAPLEFYGFFEDRLGNVWTVGDAGPSKFENGRFRTLRAHQALPGRSVVGIAEDEGGAWWVATPAGMLRLSPGELDRALSDSAYVVRYRNFGELDGLPGAINAGNFGPRVTRAVDGRIWVATDTVVASVDPSKLSTSRPPMVVIEAVRIDGEAYAPWETVAIPPRSRELEIDYTATSLSMPERIQFRYQLEGEDTGWRDVGSRRQASYTGLAPGTHRFRVTASSADGIWNEEGASWTFRVLPAWYQTWWFRAGVVLLIGGLGGAAATLVQRSRYLKAQEALKLEHEATMAERTRIAQELHDTLLQGFIGVTLQLKSAELAVSENPDVAAETIGRVQRLAWDSLREARGRVWDMRETGLLATDLVEALEASARERVPGSGIEVSVVATGARRRLGRPTEDTAFQIGREAVANAIRHSGATRLEIRVEFAKTKVRVDVRDNGRGFTVNRGEDARQGRHFGLKGMSERAAGAGGHCIVNSQPGSGTLVTLELPVSEPGAEGGER